MRGSRLAAALAVAALPLASYFLTLDEAMRPFAAAIGWATALGVAFAFARALRVAALELAVVAGAIGIAGYVAARTSHALFVPPVAIQGLLFWLFARTLLPG